jgi:hypothetical protein
MVVTQKIIHPVKAQIFGPKLAKKNPGEKKRLIFFGQKNLKMINLEWCPEDERCIFRSSRDSRRRACGNPLRECR